MGNQDRIPTLILREAESASAFEIVIRKPHARYFDHFLDLRCAPDLLALRLFPNAKEITETFAAIRAAFRWTGLDPRDPSVQAVCVGDGVTPRTAATLAFRSRWTCHSVDPLLAGDWTPVARLFTYSRRVEDVAWSFPPNSRVIVLAPHAHVELASAMERIGPRVAAAVAIPCCGFEHDAPGLPLVASYADWGVWSEHREVKVWAST